MAPSNSTSDSLPNPTNETTSNFLAPSNNIISLNNNDQLISINAVAQAPLKLTTTNYQSWQYQWETLLTVYDFLQFINEPPSTTAISKIKEICTKLASIGVHIFADEVFLHVVHGLPSEYDSIASALRARETAITFQELHDKLTDFEAHLTRRSSQTMAPIMANFAAKPPASTN
ncbi:hypothetical protein KY289_007615 [Solanum tuberosum]|nr:hypothetical protein KY289_007615 [Solanum tuberosum]